MPKIKSRALQRVHFSTRPITQIPSQPDQDATCWLKRSRRGHNRWNARDDASALISLSLDERASHPPPNAKMATTRTRVNNRVGFSSQQRRGLCASAGRACAEKEKVPIAAPGQLGSSARMAMDSSLDHTGLEWREHFCAITSHHHHHHAGRIQQIVAIAHEGHFSRRSLLRVVILGARARERAGHSSKGTTRSGHHRVFVAFPVLRCCADLARARPSIQKKKMQSAS